MLEFGGLGIGGESRVIGRQRVVRFDDDEGKGILDHDEEIHANIDHAADRLKVALCENPRFDGSISSHPSTSQRQQSINNVNDNNQQSTIDKLNLNDNLLVLLFPLLIFP